METRARVLPRPHALHGLGPYLLAAEHHPEEPLAEDLLEAGEVDVLHGEEDAVGSEEPEGNHCVEVWVMHDEVAVALRRGDHDGDGLVDVDAAERAGRLSAEEVPGGGVGYAAETTVEGSVEEEGAAEVSGDGEHELAVGDDGEDLIDEPLGPEKGSLLAA